MLGESYNINLKIYTGKEIKICTYSSFGVRYELWMLDQITEEILLDVLCSSSTPMAWKYSHKCTESSKQRRRCSILSTYSITLNSLKQWKWERERERAGGTWWKCSWDRTNDPSFIKMPQKEIITLTIKYSEQTNYFATNTINPGLIEVLHRRPFPRRARISIAELPILTVKSWGLVSLWSCAIYYVITIKVQAFQEAI